jgi:sarcosine oxidase
MPTQPSVIVLGLGIAGSSIAAALSSRGLRVTAVEQFAPLHDRGSSHGDTRIFRRVPHEGAVYVEMAEVSLRGWRSWNQAWRKADGEDLYLQSGGIDAGPESSAMVQSSESLCREYNQPFELLSGAAVNRKYPPYNLPADWRAVYQPASGVVRPDATRIFLHAQARAAGATLLHNTAVLGIEPSSSSVSVHTSAGKLTADHLIVSAGSWLPSLFPEFHLALSPERRVLAWFESSESSETSRQQSPLSTNLPIFIFDADGGWYGMPTPDGRLKLGHDKHLRQTIDPTHPPIEPNAEDAAFLARCIHNYFPGLDPAPVAMKSCIYTLTPNHHFLIDHHPSHANILIFSCCSGHGFKYAPAYGEIAADLLAGIPRPDLAALRINRSGTPVVRYAP